MFTSACHSFCLPGGLHLAGVYCVQGGWADTPIPPTDAVGAVRRYASYWNTLLFSVIFLLLNINNKLDSHLEAMSLTPLCQCKGTLNMNIRQDSLLSHLEAESLSLSHRYKRTLREIIHAGVDFMSVRVHLY